MKKGFLLIEVILAFALIGLISVTVHPTIALSVSSISRFERKSIGMDHCKRITEILRCENEVNDEYFYNMLENGTSINDYSDERIEEKLLCSVEIIEYIDSKLTYKVMTMSLDEKEKYAEFTCSRILTEKEE